jgi:mannosyltransferase OCH1-like enzyme
MTIPKILHTVWPGRDPFRPEFHAWRQSWMRHHPDWSFVFWRFGPDGTETTGDRALDELFRDPRYTAVVKSDVMRLFALAQFGGLYADTDFECLRSFDELLSVPTGFLCAREPEAYGALFSPALMASTPNHPFVRDYLERARAKVATTPIETCNHRAPQTTGPSLMGQVAAGRSDVTVVASELFYPKLADGSCTPAQMAAHQGRMRGVVPFAVHHWNSFERIKHGRGLSFGAI